MLHRDIIAEIRRRHFCRRGVDQFDCAILEAFPSYGEKTSHYPKRAGLRTASSTEPRLGEFKTRLLEWLEADAKLPKPQRCTAQRLFEGLANEGYQGAYDSIQRFLKHWKSDHRRSPSVKQAFIPLAFQPGEVCQFDWS